MYIFEAYSHAILTQSVIPSGFGYWLKSVWDLIILSAVSGGDMQWSKAGEGCPWGEKGANVGPSWEIGFKKIISAKDP